MPHTSKEVALPEDGAPGGSPPAEEEPEVSSVDGRRRVQRLFRSLLGDPLLSDCVVWIGPNTEYPCVWAILASGSPYFRAMFFSSGMTEQAEGRAELKGMSPTTWEVVQLWLYTGEV